MGDRAYRRPAPLPDVDALSPHPRDVDVKALIRMASPANILFACNQTTADAVIVAVSRKLVA